MGGVCLPVHFSPKVAFLAAREVNVSYNSDGRRKRFASSIALCALPFALSFASPALAETVTLVCESDSQGSHGTDTFIVDYSAGTISYNSWEMPAAITAEDIRFSYVTPPLARCCGSPGPANIVQTYVGSIGRITGLASWTVSRSDGGVHKFTSKFQSRCRLGTQKF